MEDSISSHRITHNLNLDKLMWSLFFSMMWFPNI